MRKNIVAGNWKMNKNLQEGIALAKELNEALAADKPNCDLILYFCALEILPDLILWRGIVIANNILVLNF